MTDDAIGDQNIVHFPKRPTLAHFFDAIQPTGLPRDQELMPSHTDIRGGGSNGENSVRLSLWTVLGSVAAAVLTAGVLGGASGILQIPQLQQDMTAIKARVEALSSSSQRLEVSAKSLELVTESLQRQVNDLVIRETAIIARLDKKDADDRTLDLATQHELQSAEASARESGVALTGEINGLKTALATLQDRERVQSEAIEATRSALYGLIGRAYSPPGQQPPPGSTRQSLPLIQPPQTSPDASPDDHGSTDTEATIHLRSNAGDRQKTSPLSSAEPVNRTPPIN